VVLTGGQAVMQAAKEPVEEVAQGGGVPVVADAAFVVVVAPVLLLPQPTTRCAPAGRSIAAPSATSVDALDEFVFSQTRAGLLNPGLLMAGEQVVAFHAPMPGDELLAAELARLDRKLDAAGGERPGCP
jgi:hypothetical protein